MLGQVFTYVRRFRELQNLKTTSKFIEYLIYWYEELVLQKVVRKISGQLVATYK